MNLNTALAAALRAAQADAMTAYEAPLLAGRFFGNDEAGRLADRCSAAAEYLERRAFRRARPS